jgi:diguanylate cyclase (GGDEF)-like protein
MQKVAILYDASQAVLSTFDLDEVFTQILRIVRDYFHLPKVAILLRAPTAPELFVRCQIGWDEGADQLRLPIGKGITGAAAKVKRPVYCPDVQTDTRYVKACLSTRSEVAIPLMLRDEVVGVLDCQSDTVNFFDAETIDLLTLFSTQASIALQNAQLYSLERRRAAQLQAINAMAKQTTAVKELKDLLQQVCGLVLESFPCDHVSVLLLEGENLVVSAHQGKLTPRFRTGETLHHAGLCSRAMETLKAVVENDVTKVARYEAGFEETRAEMCLPLVSFGQVLGVLTLESATPETFQEGDVQPLESVADICATAIQNARYFERVRQLAYVDGVTGIFNRRYFELRIAEEIVRAERYNGGLSIIMIDIDHFKRLNDEFGHLLGDEVLRQVSTIFAQQVRKSDVVCRYGGEEFAIIVPETAGESASRLADKLRAVVAGWFFPGVPRPVTISAGIAEFFTHGETRDAVVEAADKALYAAKQGGRNRVVLAPLGRAAAVQSAPAR